MAYSFTVSSVTKTRVAGRNYYRFTVAETECAAASEFNVTGLPTYGRIVKYVATKTSGAGATIAPRAGRSASWTADGQNDIGALASAAAHIDAAEKAYLPLSSNTMHFRSTPASGTDNVIATEVVIREGLD